jgi:hypothetical protein
MGWVETFWAKNNRQMAASQLFSEEGLQTCMLQRSMQLQVRSPFCGT